ncbi:MAG: hypothetical protein R3A48_04020 [Polyangiales bacterium]
MTNRIFSVTFTYSAKQMLLGDTGVQVRPLLLAAGRQVGAVGMAVDAPFDRATGTVRLEPKKPVTVAFLLSDERAESLRVVVQDPTTDAELYRSPHDIPVRPWSLDQCPAELLRPEIPSTTRPTDSSRERLCVRTSSER